MLLLLRRPYSGLLFPLLRILPLLHARLVSPVLLLLLLQDIKRLLARTLRRPLCIPVIPAGRPALPGTVIAPASVIIAAPPIIMITGTATIVIVTPPVVMIIAPPVIVIAAPVIIVIAVVGRAGVIVPVPVIIIIPPRPPGIIIPVIAIIIIVAVIIIGTVIYAASRVIVALMGVTASQENSNNSH